MTILTSQVIPGAEWTPGVEDGILRGDNKDGSAGLGKRIVFDDFESPSIYAYPSGQEIWMQYPNGDNARRWYDYGSVELSNEKTLFGTQSLKININARQPTDENTLAPYVDSVTHTGTQRLYIRNLIQNYLTRGQWEVNTYNRMEFWMLCPAHLTMPAQEYYGNLAVGTYFASVAAGGPTSSNAEVGGDHFYHHFLLVPGVWTKCMMNMHPSHRRGADGNAEQGYQEYPTNDNEQYNYFDLLTRIYFDVDNGSAGSNAAQAYFLKDIIFRENLLDEDDDHVFSVSGGWNPATNEIVISWNRRKDEAAITHEIRYAYAPVHSVGWENAITPAGGIITPPGPGGYNQMRFRTSTINTVGTDKIYFAIKQTGQTKFHHFELPLVTEVY